ncbi:MAG: aminoglycoside resistance protein [Chloroflexi bacterium]|nr:MAG: aminoglycoside resistance protein [Chloroflexota bacterium]
MHPLPDQLLPDAFVQTVHDVHGARGAAWLAALPGLIDGCARRWGLTVLPPFALSYNYAAPAFTGDGRSVVLKLGVPNPELTCEIAALRLYAGRGAVQLLEADEAQGILLLERLLPGTPLRDLPDDDQATRIAAEVMQALWRPLPPDHPFPTTARWAAGLERLRARFDGGTGPLPAALVDRAEGLFRDLLASSAPPRLLHGDLHHENILAAQRAPWLALDPKGLAGEPAYETGALLRNPPGVETWPDLRRIQARRVAILAEMLDLEPQRIAGWALAQAVLSAWWSVEDHGSGWEAAIQIAEGMADLT